MLNEQIEAVLQGGHNPKLGGSQATYHRLHVEISEVWRRYIITVEEMRGDELYYRQHKQMVGQESFIGTIRDLARQYDIHRENYEVITTKTG